MRTNKYKSSIPRERYWSSDLKDSKRCPKCNSLLEKEYKSYLLAIKTEKDVETFITGNNGGYFCSNCPVVVLDSDKFGEMAVGAHKSFGGLVSIIHQRPSVKFTVVGIVDLDAIPEDKKNKPFNDDNPIPLVKFTNLLSPKIGSEKIGRNQPCPCGSGKKYKKCCGKFIP